MHILKRTLPHVSVCTGSRPGTAPPAAPLPARTAARYPPQQVRKVLAGGSVVVLQLRLHTPLQLQGVAAPLRDSLHQQARTRGGLRREAGGPKPAAGHGAEGGAGEGLKVVQRLAPDDDRPHELGAVVLLIKLFEPVRWGWCLCSCCCSGRAGLSSVKRPCTMGLIIRHEHADVIPHPCPSSSLTLYEPQHSSELARPAASRGSQWRIGCLQVRTGGKDGKGSFCR